MRVRLSLGLARGVRLEAFIEAASLTRATEGLAAAPGFTRNGTASTEYLGWDVTHLGDVNGDGYGDVMIGATGYSNGQVGEGRLLLHVGSPAGTSATAAWSYESNIVVATVGLAIAGVGDVNGDGFADVVAGMPAVDNGQNDTGAFIAFHGSASGFPATPDLRFDGTVLGERVGQTVTGAGDVNGDGYADLLLGRQRDLAGNAVQGRVSLHLGSATGLATTKTWVATGPSGPLPTTARASAGDVNGFGDVLVGEYRANGFGDRSRTDATVHLVGQAGPRAVRLRRLERRRREP